MQKDERGARAAVIARQARIQHCPDGWVKALLGKFVSDNLAN